MGIGAAAFGVYHLVLGLFMAVAPGEFYERVGPFGPENTHYILDSASWELALGGALVASYRVVGWRVAVLAFAALQSGLHTLNHLIDIDEADPGWIGVFDFIALAIATALLAWLLTRARRTAASM